MVFQTSTSLPKPEIPYVRGWKFTIRQHIAPPSTPVIHNGFISSKESREESKKLTPLERCILHPPLAGDFGPGSIDFRIRDTIRIGDGYNSQVFLVQALSKLERIKRWKKLVTKVYDPLYVDDDDGIVDPFAIVDNDYTHEVRAYEELSDYQGGLIPIFYGSFSMDIPVEGPQTREVRLILLEYIPGLTMQQSNPQAFTKEERQLILKRVIDFESSVYKRDIYLTDFFPPNVIITQNLHERPLVFVDFARSNFGRVGDDMAHMRALFFPGQYISPIVRWGLDRARIFADWIIWDWRPWIEKEYSHTASSITADMWKMYCPNYTKLSYIPWHHAGQS
ncbi:hypothetical protein TRVA0_020S01948 [Trichomonascus vanleenenianus]|uniref:uncharacterized protein n=1 Tax=Trichomonascus vanleenenianus TaxID=2268995 RepID=UPI003ECB3D7B